MNTQSWAGRPENPTKPFFTGWDEKDFSKYKFLACSANSDGKVNSYIARVQGRKVYGYFDHKKNSYIEEPA